MGTISRSALLLVALICQPIVVGADDSVQARSSDGTSYEVRGAVDDYTGKLLTIQVASGRLQKIPADRVVEVTTTWPEEKALADQAFDDGDWQQAAALYSKANGVEKRNWARRMLLTRLLQCLNTLGREERAGDLFVMLTASDPYTPAWRYAPLSWAGETSVAEAKAAAWLAAEEQPAAALLGASHSLASPMLVEARSTLLRLAKEDDPSLPIDELAEAQLWRTRLTGLQIQQVENWARRADQFTDAAAAGGHFLLGQAYQRLQRPDLAVLHYLRPPLLFPEHNRRLSARSLDAAARLLASGGRQEESERLIAELIDAYPETLEATAQQRLRDAAAQ